MGNKIEVKADLDPSGFKRGIEQVKRGLDSVNDKVGKVTKAMGGMLGAVGVAAVGKAVGSAVIEGDKIARAADSSGANVEDLQRLALFARLDFDQAGKIVGNVNASIGKGLSGDKTQMEALIAAGFSASEIKDGGIDFTKLLLRLGETASKPGKLSDPALNDLLQSLGFGARGREFVRGLRGDTKATFFGNERSIASAESIAIMNLSRSNLDSYGEASLAIAIEKEANSLRLLLKDENIRMREAQLSGVSENVLELRDVQGRLDDIRNRKVDPRFFSAATGYGASQFSTVESMNSNNREVLRLQERIAELLEDIKREVSRPINVLNSEFN